MMFLSDLSWSLQTALIWKGLTVWPSNKTETNSEQISWKKGSRSKIPECRSLYVIVALNFRKWMFPPEKILLDYPIHASHHPDTFLTETDLPKWHLNHCCCGYKSKHAIDISYWIWIFIGYFISGLWIFMAYYNFIFQNGNVVENVAGRRSDEALKIENALNQNRGEN